MDLIRSDKYSEKNVGYVGVSLLLIEHTDMLRMCINTIRNDLKSRNEIFQCLALTCVANVGGPEFAESLVPDVQALLVSGTSRNFVRKKSALCLLRLLRQYPDNCPSPQVAPQIIKLAEHRNVGVVTSVLSLLTGLATYDTASYSAITPVAVRLLHQFVINRECSKEYIYYRTPCPWLQVKLLRILQYYPPPKDKNLLNKLHDILDRIVTKTEVTQSVNKNHADHSILFEAMNVIIHLNLHGEDMLHDRAIHKLLHFINVKEGNIRYLGLDAMARLAKIANTHKLIKRHLRTIQYSLDDSDISIGKRALDLLYSICDENNVVEIIEHLLRYLTKAEFGIREEMVLKIAILADVFSAQRAQSSTLSPRHELHFTLVCAVRSDAPSNQISGTCLIELFGSVCPFLYLFSAFVDPLLQCSRSCSLHTSSSHGLSRNVRPFSAPVRCNYYFDSILARKCIQVHLSDSAHWPDTPTHSSTASQMRDDRILKPISQI